MWNPYLGDCGHALKAEYLMCLPRPILPNSPALDAVPRVGPRKFGMSDSLYEGITTAAAVAEELELPLGCGELCSPSVVVYLLLSPSEQKESFPFQFLVPSHLSLTAFNQSLCASPFPSVRWGHQHSSGTSWSPGPTALPQSYLLVFFVPFLTWSWEAGGLLLTKFLSGN